MMKWKARKETTNIGVLELGNLTFNEDYMEISIDIFDMSDSMKAEVNKAIEITKVKHTEEREADNMKRGKNRNTTWSNKPVIMDFTYLRVILEEGKPIDYSINIGFHDAVDDSIEYWGCGITVDLSEYSSELKKAVVKAMIDKFF